MSYVHMLLSTHRPTGRVSLLDQGDHKDLMVSKKELFESTPHLKDHSYKIVRMETSKITNNMDLRAIFRSQ